MADYNYKVNKDKDGSVAVEAKANKSRYELSEEQALHKLAPTVKVDGFRPGKAPKQVIVSKLGTKLIEEALNILLPAVAVEIIATEKLNPVTQLEYKVTNIDQEGNVEFSFEFANYPQIKLGDFSKIKVKRGDVKIEDKDINEVLIRLFKESYQQANPDAKEANDEQILGWVDDAQVKKQMGKEYDTLEKLKSDINKQLSRVREQEEQEKFEQQIIDKAIEISELQIPAKLISAEVERKEASYRGRIKELDIEFDVFIAAQNTSLEKLREQWQLSATKEIQTDFLLAQIASEHKLVPTEAEIDAEIAKVSDTRMRLELKGADGHRYVASMIMRQRGFAKLMELSGVNATKSNTN